MLIHYSSIIIMIYFLGLIGCISFFQLSSEQSPSIFYHTLSGDEFWANQYIDENSTELPINIKSVTINSDGKDLNATLWLTKPLNNSNFEFYKKSNLQYHLDIYFTDRLDQLGSYSPLLAYTVIIYPQDSGWVKKLIEYSVDNLENRTIYKTNYANFYEDGKNFLEINLDLSSIGYPSQYKLSASSNAFVNETNYNMSTTNFLVPSGANIFQDRFQNNEYIELHQGEEKKNIVYNVDIFDLENAHHLSLQDGNLTDQFSMSFSPENITTPLNGTVPFIMTLKIGKDVKTGLHQLPVIAKTKVLGNDEPNPDIPLNINILVNAPISIVEQISLWLTQYYGYLWLPFGLTTLIILILHNKFKKIIVVDIKSKDLLSFNSAIIAGVLVFLSIGNGTNFYNAGFFSQTGLLTASIVTPFSISAIRVLILGKAEFGIKFALAGFIYIIFSVIIISFPPAYP
jgi:hypothetical protein